MVRPSFPRLVTVLAALSLACTAHREEPASVEAAKRPAEVPPVEPMTLEVVASWPDRDAIEIERSVVVPLERTLGRVPALKRMHSSARAGRATIVLTLDGAAAPWLILAAVDDQIGLAREQLPAEVFTSFAAGLAAPGGLAFSLSSTGDFMQLQRVARALREALLVLPGVADVEVCGGAEARVEVAVDPARLSAYRLSIAALVPVLRDSLHEAPGLSADLRVLAGVRSMEQLMDVIVTSGEHPVRLRDVASVAIARAPGECEARRVGGGEAVLGLVKARPGVDAPAFAAAVRAELAARSAGLPMDARLELPTNPPLRLALELTAAAEPAETLSRASLAIAEAFTAAGLSPSERAAFLRTPTPSHPGVVVDGELGFDATGLAAAELAGLERRLAALPGVAVRGPIGDPTLLRLRVTGAELEVDRRLAREAAEIAAKVPGVVRAAARDDQHPELVLELQRERMATYGLAASELSLTLAAALGGAPVGELQLDGTRMPMVVRLGAEPVGRAATLATLPRLEIGLPAGGTVRLDELVQMRTESAPGTITRVDGQRSVSVEVRVGAATPAQQAALQRALAEGLGLPSGYTLVWDPPVP